MGSVTDYVLELSPLVRKNRQNSGTLSIVAIRASSVCKKVRHGDNRWEMNSFKIKKYANCGHFRHPKTTSWSKKESETI